MNGLEQKKLEMQGEYDRYFNNLPQILQEEELRRQLASEVVTKKRLKQYCRRHVKELDALSNKMLFEHLIGVVFGTINLDVIVKKYPQKQRSRLRLLIDVQIKSIKRPALWDRPSTKLLFGILPFVLLFAFYLGLEKISQNTNTVEINKQVLAIDTPNKIQRLPKRLTIPIINVSALVEYVGTTANNEMGVPRDTDNVGWFSLGTQPGNAGSAVIAGHFTKENGEDGVFANLDKLKSGDKIYIEDIKGIITVFTVRENKMYDPGYAPDVFKMSDRAQLNLVTCDGFWNNNKNSYTKRLVVFADIVD